MIDYKRDTFWTCTGYHQKGKEKWEWSQWFTWDKTQGCPEHGTELLRAHPPIPPRTYGKQ